MRMCILIVRNVYLLNCIKSGKIVFPNIFVIQLYYVIILSMLFAE